MEALNFQVSDPKSIMTQCFVDMFTELFEVVKQIDGGFTEDQTRWLVDEIYHRYSHLLVGMDSDFLDDVSDDRSGDTGVLI